ncbi:MAG TPA: hypothetical protein VFF69_06985 [Phycisphaerales bacterium]|nr:hypothetical protein [Phycisphaerales bacterium]
MKMQTRVLGILAAVGLAACPSLAIPPALDRVPADTPVVIGIRDVSHLSGGIKQWAGMFVPEEEMAPFALAEQLLSTPGLNSEGSAAVAVTFGEDGTPQEPVLVLSVSDYDAFVEAMQGQSGDEVATIRVMEDEGYVKDLGDGFMALGPDFDAVSAFAGEAGQLGSHRERLGEVAAAAAEDADAFVVVDVESMRPFLEQGLEQMQQGMAMAAMMGGEAVQGQMEMMMNAARSVVNDGRTAFVGMSTGESGLSLDLAAQFKDDSQTGSVFAEGGNAAELMEKLPAMEYVFAFAIDTSSEGLRNLMSEASKLNQGMSFGASMGKLAELHDGQAMVVGTTPGLLAGGLFTNTVQYTRSDDPEQLLNAYEEVITGINGEAQQGMKFTTTFERDAAMAGDTPLHAYGLTMDVDPNDENAMAASMALQQMSMIFGGEAGPKGYLALTDGGMYQTMTRNTALITKALEGGESLDGNAGIGEIAGELPESRTAEAYVNVKGVIDMVAPMLAMMGGGVSFDDVPEDLHPIGASLTTGGAGMHGRLFVPGDVIELFSSIAEQLEGAEDEWEEVEEEPESKPRF